MKVCLINPCSEIPDGRPGIPLAFMYLVRYLEKAGHEVSTYDYLKDDWDKCKPKIIKELVHETPDVVGVQCMTYNRTAAVKLAKLVKELLPDCKVVFGGVHATIMPEQLLRNFEEIDFVVVGEGEITFPELIANFDNPENVKGIAFMKGKEFVKTEPRPLIENLDTLPIPKWEIFKEEYKRLNRVMIYSSRGCIFHCTFCSTAHFWKNKWRARSPKHVVDEIEAAQKIFPGCVIDFCDDCFSRDNNRVKEICAEIKRRNLKFIWYCETRIDMLTEELVKIMYDAGCRRASIGIESGSQKMMDSLHKGYNVEKVLKNIKMCHRLGIKTSTLLMTGIPGETREDIEKTKKFLTEMKKDNPYFNNQLEEVAVLWLFPGTPLYEKAKIDKFITDDYWLTEKKAPFYTYEWSYDVLRSRASEIVLHHHKLYGWPAFIWYVFKGAVNHPIKFVKFVIGRNYWKVMFRKK